MAAGVIVVLGGLLKAAATVFIPMDKPLPLDAPAMDARAHAAGHEAKAVELFQRATAALAARRYEEAVTGLTSLLAIAPNLPEAHVNMGFALLGLNRFTEARDHFLMATDLRRMQVNAYYGLALAYEGLDDLVLARGAMRSYSHLAGEKDPYRDKAKSYLEKWNSALEAQKTGANGGGASIEAPANRSVPKNEK